MARGAKPARPRSEAVAPVKEMKPCPAWSMSGITAWAKWTAPIVPTSNEFRMISGSSSRKGPRP